MNEITEKEKHLCCKGCGFNWLTGENGEHDCSVGFKAHIKALTEALGEAKDDERKCKALIARLKVQLRTFRHNLIGKGSVLDLEPFEGGREAMASVIIHELDNVG